MDFPSNWKDPAFPGQPGYRISFNSRGAGLQGNLDINLASHMEAVKAELPYTFRPYTEADIPFLQSSWGTSYYKGANYIEFLTPQEFHATHRPIRECFFMRPTATAIVCAATSDENTILGWVALERPTESSGIIVHYLYVKDAFREQGIGTDLLSMATREFDGPRLFTHKTHRASVIMQKKRENFKNYFFYPHLI